MNINFSTLVKPEYMKVFNNYVETKGIKDQWNLLANLASLGCLIDDWHHQLDLFLNDKLGVNFMLEKSDDVSNLSSTEEYSIQQADDSSFLVLPARDRDKKDIAMRKFEDVSKIFYILPFERKDFSYDIRLLTDIILFDAKSLKSTDIHFVVESDMLGGFNYPVKFRRGIGLETQTKYKITRPVLDDIINDLLANRSSVGQKRAELAISAGVRFRLEDPDYPARCQIGKSIGGKTLTMRLFDFSRAPSVEGLGFDKETEKMLHSISKTFSGLTLVSGAFGSGKGTTLNAVGMIMEEDGELAIASLDDPIEYLRKYNQYEYSSDQQLREFVDAFKKMDLNAIFLNEIITGPTADAVYNLVSAGVHVLSTVHTNRFYRIMYKLNELFGVSYINLIPFLNVISYQDKFSITCKDCLVGIAAESYSENSDERKLLDFLGLSTIKQPVGCSNCSKGIRKTGIKVVSEHLVLTDSIKGELLTKDIHAQFVYLRQLSDSINSLEKSLAKDLFEGEVLISEVLVKLDTWR